MSQTRWSIELTETFLTCREATTNVRIYFSLATPGLPYAIQSTNPALSLTTDNEALFIAMKNVLLQQLMQTIAVPEDVQQAVLRYVPAKAPEAMETVLPETIKAAPVAPTIRTKEDMHTIALEAIAVDNPAILEAVVNQYFAKQLPPELATTFWRRLSDFIPLCIKNIFEESKDARRCFIYLFTVCQQHVDEDSYKRFIENAHITLRHLALGNTYEEVITVALIKIILRDSPSRADIVKGEGILRRAAHAKYTSPLKLLLPHCDPAIINRYDVGKRAISAALEKFNFEAIVLLLNAGAVLTLCHDMFDEFSGSGLCEVSSVSTVFSWLEEAKKRPGSARAVEIITDMAQSKATLDANDQPKFKALLDRGYPKGVHSNEWRIFMGTLSMTQHIHLAQVGHLLSHFAPQMINDNHLPELKTMLRALCAHETAKNYINSPEAKRTVAYNIAQLIHRPGLTKEEVIELINLLSLHQTASVPLMEIKATHQMEFVLQTYPDILTSIATQGASGFLAALYDTQQGKVFSAKNTFNVVAALIAAIKHLHPATAALLLAYGETNLEVDHLKLMHALIDVSNKKISADDLALFKALKEAIEQMIRAKQGKRAQDNHSSHHFFGQSNKKTPPPRTDEECFRDLSQPIQKHFEVYARMPYESLQVGAIASKDAINKAFKELTFKYHPDKNPQGKEKFQEISCAKTILDDETLREECSKWAARYTPSTRQFNAGSRF